LKNGNHQILTLGKKVRHMRKFNGLMILRIGLATIFVSHSLMRTYMGTVDDFGEKFLDAKGFAPFGLCLAIGITGFEFLGGLLLLAGRWVRLVALVFVGQMACGIWLVHWPHGWFVVGHGTNGIEYSVLIITGLLAVAFPPPGQLNGANP
jgi:putative oxidoreductase